MTPQMAALLAQYNQRMNQQVFDAAGRLDEAQLMADKGAFFGSILGTLNHIAVGDLIWLHRFADHPASFSALSDLSEFPRPSSLRQLLAPGLAGLQVYRTRLDGLIQRWVAELTVEHLSRNLQYSNMAGVASSKNFGALVQHFFNHQTHHRGQVSTLLFQAGVDVGVTDFLAVIPNSDF